MNEVVKHYSRFDLSIVSAIESASSVIEKSNSPNTKKAFEGDIKYFENWCTESGIDGIRSMRKEHLIFFIMDHVEKHKISTIKRRIATLSRFMDLNHMDNPCYSKDIVTLIRKLTEKYGESKAYGKAITLDVLNELLKTCQNDGLVGIRDSAILLFGFSTGGRRRTEISNSTMENLTQNSDGTFIYNLTKSKTNKTGSDDPKPLVGRAAMALSFWLRETGINEGPIFRGVGKDNIIFNEAICDRQVARIVKSRCEKAGFDPKEYTAHSLRSGFVTESGKRGKPLGDVMAMTGHKSMKEVMRYYKTGDIMNNSAAYLAG